MPSTFPDPAHPNTSAPLAGDIARRRARLGLLAFLIAVPISWALFSQIEPIWARIMPLEGFTFMATATLLGAVLAVVPLVAIIGFVLAIWFGVDSVYMTKRRASRLLDQFMVAVALVVWFSPALFGVVTAGRAIYEGRIHFVRPPRDYLG